uniref:hypothetical protein n=1 Tax=Eubacterium cellulosolvens TaxID=29322 RepID=UPI0012DC0D57|nr:hypothetical protein [[Eubacterium] cellulosolvens]
MPAGCTVCRWIFLCNRIMEAAYGCSFAVFRGAAPSDKISGSDRRGAAYGEVCLPNDVTLQKENGEAAGKAA